MSIRVVQIHNGKFRRVALVEEPSLRLVSGFDSVWAMARAAKKSLSDLVKQNLTDDLLSYDEIYSGKSDWKILPPLDHPTEPANCLVSGTGLTHVGSARDRQSMHGVSIGDMTDSMKMFHLGLQDGKPPEGKIGVAPEWFYKGNGTTLRTHGEELIWPSFAEDGGEEGEVAGLYVISRDGVPLRVGMAVGNEFSDHVFEKKNYLNLAGSKLRTCSIGPELVIDPEFKTVPGQSTIERGGQKAWSKEICTGEEEMCHSLANIEHHHFKFPEHRRPGDVHVHYYGAHSLSFGDGFKCQDGDVMTIRFDGFGRALKNVLKVEPGDPALQGATALK